VAAFLMGESNLLQTWEPALSLMSVVISRIKDSNLHSRASMVPSSPRIDNVLQLVKTRPRSTIVAEVDHPLEVHAVSIPRVGTYAT